MAEGEEPNDNLLWSVIGFIFIMLVLGTYLGKYSQPSVAGNGAPAGSISTSQVERSPKEESLFGRFLTSEPIVEGGKVINASIAKVRQTVGGAVIGEQEKRAVATVIEGPVNAFGEKWYRLNYKEAPDGWVSEGDITANIGAFRALNILPILFNVLRPIGLLLALIFLAVLLLVIARQRKTIRLVRKKKEVEREQAPSNAFAERIKGAQQPIVAVEGGETHIYQASAPPEIHTPAGPGKVENIIDTPGVPTNLPTGDISNLTFKKSGTKLDEATGAPKNEKWIRVERLMSSYNTSDWKQAVIEADIMLEEMLNKMGYQGGSIGEKLKQIEESDFVTLNQAWEAHKVRNKIAHQGGGFVVSKDEAERVIGLYKKVFEEFFYI